MVQINNISKLELTSSTPQFTHSSSSSPFFKTDESQGGVCSAVEIKGYDCEDNTVQSSRVSSSSSSAASNSLISATPTTIPKDQMDYTPPLLPSLQKMNTFTPPLIIDGRQPIALQQSPPVAILVGSPVLSQR